MVSPELLSPELPELGQNANDAGEVACNRPEAQAKGIE
jgi:hypothetical protein